MGTQQTNPASGRDAAARPLNYRLTSQGLGVNQRRRRELVTTKTLGAAMVAPAIYDEAISMVRWASAATMAVMTIAVVAIVIVATNLLRRWLAPWSKGQ